MKVGIRFIPREMGKWVGNQDSVFQPQHRGGVRRSKRCEAGKAVLM